MRVLKEGARRFARVRGTALAALIAAPGRRSAPRAALAAALLALALALAASALGLLPSAPPEAGAEGSVQGPSHQEAALERASVVRVVDGDTLVVDRGNGDEKVRLIGIDCPESVNPDQSKNTEEGRAASGFAKSVVSAGQPVWLQKDVSEADRYGRLLRYVWLSEPEDAGSVEEARTGMLNAILIANGQAVAKEYRPDTAYSSVFEEIAPRRQV